MLKDMNVKQLRQECKKWGVKNYANFKKSELITHIEEAIKSKEDKENERLAKELLDRIEKKAKRAEQAAKKETEEVALDKNREDGNIISAVDIAKELGIRGQKARRILRKSNIERPYKRWEWDKKKHKHIIKQVKKLLKGEA